MDGPRLDLPLEPSRRLLVAQSLLHLAALAAAAMSAPGMPLCALLWFVVGASLARQIAAFAAWRRGGVLWLRCRAGAWTLADATGGREVTVLGESTVWPWLVVLRLGLPRGRRTLVLLEDSLPPGGLRALRASLRTAGTSLKG
jgi:hypothetical protein